MKLLRTRAKITPCFGALRRTSGKARKGAHSCSAQLFVQRSSMGWIDIPKHGVISARALICLLLLVLSVNSSVHATSFISVISPKPDSFVDTGIINIVLKADKANLDLISISAMNEANKAYSAADIPIVRDIVYYGITLHAGMNQVKIAAVKQGRTLEQIELQIYYRDKGSNRYKEPPTGYEKNIFHTPAKEAGCVTCHDMDGTPQKPKDSTCKICHRRIIGFKFVHGPAAVWACLSCHDEDSEKGKYAVVKPDSKLCIRCHDETMQKWAAKKYRHGPSLVSCTICHDPHATDEPFRVHIQTTSHCVSCHEDKASGAHVIRGFSSMGHPTRGVPDPLRPGREFTCAGCHNPHADDTPNLLYYDNTRMNYFCTICHER